METILEGLRNDLEWANVELNDAEDTAGRHYWGYEIYLIERKIQKEKARTEVELINNSA